MSVQAVITLRQVCDHFHVDFELVRDFAEFGLYPTVLCDGEIGIEARNLEKLKRIIGLYQALGINKEGIEVILELGEQISGLQREVEALQDEVERWRRHWGTERPQDPKGLGLLIEIDDGG